MCGIVGYIGEKPADYVILNALKKLEYRGYDSAGISLLTEDGKRQNSKFGKSSVPKQKICFQYLRYWSYKQKVIPAER